MAGVQAAVANTDCSAFDARDALLGRAGWAAVQVDRHGCALRVHIRQVDGPQTNWLRKVPLGGSHWGAPVSA